MTGEQNSKPSFFARLLGVILRLIFVFVVGICLGAGLYFGFQAFYNQFVSPVQEHALRIEALEMHQQQSDQIQAQRLEGLTGRMETIEIQGDTNRESLSILVNRIDQIQAVQATQAADFMAVQNELDMMATSISAVEQDVRAQEEQIQSNYDDVFEEIENLSATQEALRTEVAEAGATIADYEQDFLELQGQVDRQIQALAAMELLTRARLNLAQGNLSLARVDIEAARSLISGIQDAAASDQMDYFEEILDRLDTASEFLPLEPVSAADELEGAWQLLQESLALETATPLANRTPAATAALTPTPTP